VVGESLKRGTGGSCRRVGVAVASADGAEDSAEKELESSGVPSVARGFEVCDTGCPEGAVVPEFAVSVCPEADSGRELFPSPVRVVFVSFGESVAAGDSMCRPCAAASSVGGGV